MQMKREEDAGSAFGRQSKMCSPSLLLSPSLVFFLFRCVSAKWESVCIHEDQLQGIPISTTGFFPSVVLFSAEGTVLFHLSERASSIALCVCASIYLGCTEALTERMLNNCRPLNHTPQPHPFWCCTFRFFTNTCAWGCMCLCDLIIYWVADAFHKITPIVSACKQDFLVTDSISLFA